MSQSWSNKVSSVTTLMVVFSVGALAAPAQASQWSTPVQPPVGCRTTPSGAPSLALNAAGAWVIAAYAITVFAVIQTTGTLTYASLRPAGGTWGAPTQLSAANDKGEVGVAGDAAGTFVVIWNNAAGTVEAVTLVPGGVFSPGTPVGAAPSRRLHVPGKAVLWTAAGISIESV